jgi:DNA modification methylase
MSDLLLFNFSYKMKFIHEIQHWEEMKNQVICGDALEMMKKIPDKSIDLVLTDPPYGIQENLFSLKK